jgi:hypothetical protein
MAELTLGAGMVHGSLIATDDPQIWLRHEVGRAFALRQKGR